MSRTVYESLHIHETQREAADAIKEYLRHMKLTYLEAVSIVEAVAWELRVEERAEANRK